MRLYPVWPKLGICMYAISSWTRRLNGSWSNNAYSSSETLSILSTMIFDSFAVEDCSLQWFLELKLTSWSVSNENDLLIVRPLIRQLC